VWAATGPMNIADNANARIMASNSFLYMSSSALKQIGLPGLARHQFLSLWRAASQIGYLVPIRLTSSRSGLLGQQHGWRGNDSRRQRASTTGAGGVIGGPAQAAATSARMGRVINRFIYFHLRGGVHHVAFASCAHPAR
jgi:hypothetical protein